MKGERAPKRDFSVEALWKGREREGEEGKEGWVVDCADRQERGRERCGPVRLE